jgi:hypothetical protein
LCNPILFELRLGPTTLGRDWCGIWELPHIRQFPPKIVVEMFRTSAFLLHCVLNTRTTLFLNLSVATVGTLKTVKIVPFQWHVGLNGNMTPSKLSSDIPTKGPPQSVTWRRAGQLSSRRVIQN